MSAFRHPEAGDPVEEATTDFLGSYFLGSLGIDEDFVVECVVEGYTPESQTSGVVHVVANETQTVDFTATPPEEPPRGEEGGEGEGGGEGGEGGEPPPREPPPDP